MRPILCLALLTACGAGQSDHEQFKSALTHTPPMVNPALTQAADPVVSSSWDSTYRMLSFSPDEACFLAEWDVPASLAPGVRFRLEGWRSLDEERRAVPAVASSSMQILEPDALARIKANDPPVADDVPPEIRAMRPRLTPMRVCFATWVIRPDTRYLVIRLAIDEDSGRHHETGAGWRLVPPRAAAAR